MRLFLATALAISISPLPATAAIDQSQDQKQDYGADRGPYDGGDDPGSQVNAQVGQQPTADQGADDSDGDVGNQTKAGALYHLACKPSRDQTNKQDYQ
jgi:hypothetical protein